MKYTLLMFFLCTSITCMAQTSYQADIIHAKQTLKVAGNSITAIDNDTALHAKSATSIPTQYAVYEFVKNRGEHVSSFGSISGAITAQSNLYDTLQNRISVINVLNFGAKGDGITDDTRAIQSAINACIGSDSSINGVVYFPYTGNDYMIKGPLINSDTFGFNPASQLYIPVTAYNNTKKIGTIKLIGQVSPTMFTDEFSTTQTVPRAVRLHSTNVSTNGSVIGSAGTTGFSGNQNFTELLIENLYVDVRSKTSLGIDTVPTMTGIDASKLTMFEAKSLHVETETAQNKSLQPASSAIGIKMPVINNWVESNLNRVVIQNFYSGVQASEHFLADNLIVATCYNGIEFLNSYHPIQINKMYTLWCKYGIVFSGNAYVNISQLDIEDFPASYATKWFNNIYDLYDNNTGSSATINYHRVLAGTGIDNANFSQNAYAANNVKINASPLGSPNNFNRPITITDTQVTGVGASINSPSTTMIINLNATKPDGTGGVALAYRKKGVLQFQLGNDWARDGHQNLFIYDSIHGVTPLIIDDSDWVNLGGNTGGLSNMPLLRIGPDRLLADRGIALNRAWSSHSVGLDVTTPYPSLVDTIARYSTSSTYGGVFVNNFANKQAGIYLQKNGSTKFNFGIDYNANGTNDFFIYDGSTGRAPFFIDPSDNVKLSSLSTGSVYSNAGTFTNTNPSDRRLKHLVKPVQYGLKEILQLNPVSFFYNTDSTNRLKQFGFIAQEVKNIMPDAVRPISPDSKYLGLEKDAIYTTLVNAVKELQLQIDLLKKQIPRTKK